MKTVHIIKFQSIRCYTLYMLIFSCKLNGNVIVVKCLKPLSVNHRCILKHSAGTTDWLFFTIGSVAYRSGMNFSGSGQCSGSWWRKPAGISNVAPLGNNWPFTTQSCSISLANLCRTKCHFLLTPKPIFSFSHLSFQCDFSMSNERTEITELVPKERVRNSIKMNVYP